MSPLSGKKPTFTIRKRLRVAILLPANTSFYKALLKSLIIGFENNNVEAFGELEPLNNSELHDYCRQKRPDILLDMNRSKSSLWGLPVGVKHIAWIVDTQGRDFSEFQGSDILYLFVHQWRSQCDERQAKHVDWLPPGTCPATYYCADARQHDDFSFVGHIPKPWSDEERRRIVYHDAHTTIRFDEALEHFIRVWHKHNPDKLYFADPVEVAKNLLNELVGTTVQIDDLSLRYDLFIRSMRLLVRRQLLDQVMVISDSISLYGPENWRSWPRYAPYYRHFIHDPAKIRMVFQSTRINLHAGENFHFRFLDCMSSGALIGVVTKKKDDQPGGINTMFEPGIHYLPIDADEDKVRRILADRNLRRKMGMAAATEVNTGHTWKHRVRKILDDLVQID